MNACTKLMFIVFSACAANTALANEGCEFQPPTPILQAHAYAGQTVTRRSDNRLQESGQVDPGLRVEIGQSACADFLTTEFVFVASGAQRDDAGWIAFARSALARLKTRASAREAAALATFLRRAPTLPLRDGSRSACRDGSSAAAGQCTWDSQGGFVLSIRRGARTTRVRLTDYRSG